MSAPVRLLISAASPFARKCRVVIRERALTGIQEVVVDPMASAAMLTAANPLSQVQTLVLEDGTALFNSPLICAFLDRLGDRAPLAAPDDFDTLQRQALGDGVAELAVKLRYDQVRPDGEQSPSAQARLRAGVVRAIDAAEAQDRSEDRFDLGEIALVCALSYVDLRHGDLNWRDGRPRLAALVERLEQRPSFIDARA